MKILGIEHIGIAVKSLENDAPFWKHVLGISHQGREVVKSQGVTTDIYETGKGKIELLEAIGIDSPITNFIEKRGPGIHHICLEVEDLMSALEELKKSNLKIINEEPTTGIEGSLVTFIHPKSTGGVLVELVQKK